MSSHLFPLVPPSWSISKVFKTYLIATMMLSRCPAIVAGAPQAWAQSCL